MAYRINYRVWDELGAILKFAGDGRIARRHRRRKFKERSNMNAKTEARDSSTALKLDQSALDAAAKSLDEGAVTPSFTKHREDIIELLNGALATELVCVLRYKRHYFTATGVNSSKIADEFLVHANEESGHADRLATRIVQLGGSPDFSPDSLTARSHADYDESADLKAMVKANLVAERIAVESYRQMINLIGELDPTTRRMLEDILADEEEHADELSDWLSA
jgi:bacterioferritin